MRLTPIEKPKGWKLRAAYAYSKARLGRAITPLTVVYARTPAALGFARGISAYTEKGVRLNPGLRLLLQTHVARINDCGFCLDIGKAAEGLGWRPEVKFDEGLRALAQWFEESHE